MSLILALKDKLFPKEAPAKDYRKCPCEDIMNKAIEAARRNEGASERDLDRIADKMIHDICIGMREDSRFTGKVYVNARRFYNTVRDLSLSDELETTVVLDKTKFRIIREKVLGYFQSKGFVVYYQEQENGRFDYMEISIPHSKLEDS